MRPGIIARIVPAECRAAFGKVVVAKSLNTTSETEAERLEKEHDVDFERRLRRARDDANPNTRRARLAEDIIKANRLNPTGQMALAYLPAEDREAVRAIVVPHYACLDAHRQEIAQLVYEIEQALPQTALDPDIWQRCRIGILSVVRQHVANVTGALSPSAIDGIDTLEWAYQRWLRAGGDDRGTDVVKLARRHFDAFVEHRKLVMLADVRRLHVLAWRDSVVDAGEHKAKSINQRVQPVAAILRQGWRDAEMPQPDLEGDHRT